jgi:hypothetical protein
VQKISREREIDIEAVTKMVRRRVYKQEHAKDDYYVRG